MKILSTFIFTQEEINKIKSLGVDIRIYSTQKELCEYNEYDNVNVIIADHRTLQTDFMENYKQLKWIHLPHVGIERLPMGYLKTREIIVTNARGTAGIPISEDVFCKMLVLARKYQILSKQQMKRQWGNPGGITNLSGKTIGILGTGDVGSEIAKKAKAFNMRTLGLNTSGKSVAGFDETYKSGDINKLITQSDFIVCTIPITKESYYLVNRAQFEVMKSTAFIINVSRADLFNEEILYEYLKEKKIAGAALDVFTQEFTAGRLPVESRFWDLDNLIISPHMAAAGDEGRRKKADVIMHNIECFCSNRIKEMVNIRNYDNGY